MQSSLKFTQISPDQITLSLDEAEALARVYAEVQPGRDPTSLTLGELATQLQANPQELAKLLARLRGTRPRKHVNFPNRWLVGVMIVGAMAFWISVAANVISARRLRAYGNYAPPVMVQAQPPPGFDIRISDANTYAMRIEANGPYNGMKMDEAALKADKNSSIQQLTNAFADLIKSNGYITSSNQPYSQSSVILWMRTHYGGAGRSQEQDSDWIPFHVRLPSEDATSDEAKKAIKSAIFKHWQELYPATSDSSPSQ